MTPEALTAPSRPWILSGCYLLLYTGFALSFPFMAVFLGQDLGIPLETVGAYLSSCVLASALGQAAGGRLSDRLGRKIPMAGALAARGLFAAALALAVARRSFPLVAAAQLLYNFFGSAFEPASRSWVADMYGPRERLKIYSFLRVASNVGWALGPALGSLFSLAVYPRLFGATAAASLACAAIVAALIPESRRRGAGDAEALLLAPADEPGPRVLEPAPSRGGADRRFLLYCLWTALISVVTAQIVVGLSLHATRYAGLSARQVGLLFSENGLLVVFLQSPVTALLAKTPLTAALSAGCLLYAAGYAAVGFAGGLKGLLAAVAVVTVGEVTLMPALFTLAANLSPDRLRGRYMGLHGLAYQLGLAAGPLAGGWGLARLSPGGAERPWLLIAALAAASTAGFHRFKGRLSPEENLQ